MLVSDDQEPGPGDIAHVAAAGGIDSRHIATGEGGKLVRSV